MPFKPGDTAYHRSANRLVEVASNEDPGALDVNCTWREGEVFMARRLPMRDLLAVPAGITLEQAAAFAAPEPGARLKP